MECWPFFLGIFGRDKEPGERASIIDMVAGKRICGSAEPSSQPSEKLNNNRPINCVYEFDIERSRFSILR